MNSAPTPHSSWLSRRSCKKNLIVSLFVFVVSSRIQDMKKLSPGMFLCLSNGRENVPFEFRTSRTFLHVTLTVAIKETVCFPEPPVLQLWRFVGFLNRPAAHWQSHDRHLLLFSQTAHYALKFRAVNRLWKWGTLGNSLFEKPASSHFEKRVWKWDELAL